MTVQLWGEFPRGDWKLLVSSADGSIGKKKYFISITIQNLSKHFFLIVQLDDFMIIIHGTKTKPVDYENYIETDQVNVSLLSSYESYQIYMSSNIYNYAMRLVYLILYNSIILFTNNFLFA